MKKLLQIFTTDSLRGRYKFFALALFIILVLAAIIGLNKMETAVEQHHAQEKERTSFSNSIHSFTDEYYALKYDLLGYLIRPDTEHYSAINNDLRKLYEKYDALHKSELQVNDNLFRSNLKSLETTLNQLKQETAAIIEVRADPEKTFPFASFMIVATDNNSKILSTIDRIILTENEKNNTQLNHIKEILKATRNTWSSLMADFRLLVAIRFGFFTGDSEKAFEQCMANINVFIEQTREDQKKIAKIISSYRPGFEIKKSINSINKLINLTFKEYQQATTILESREWRKDLSLLDERLKPAFTKLDLSIDALILDIERHQEESFKKLGSLSNYLFQSLWILLIIYLMLIMLSYYLFDRAILVPMGIVAEALKKEAEGNTIQLRSLDSADEIANLTRAFNEMRSQIASRQKRLTTILDNAAEAIITIDHDGLIETFNAAAEELFGYKPRDIIGKNVLMLLPEDTRDYYQTLFNEFQNNPKLATNDEVFEVNVLRSDNKQIPTSIKVSKTLIDDKILYTGLVVDDSERIAAELENKRHLATMAHAGRLSIMGEMAASIAHEINQPLAAMSLYLRGSLRRYQPDTGKCEEVIKAVNSALTQVDRADQIIRKMRGFARRDAFDREVIDLNIVIERAVDLMLISEESDTFKIEISLNEKPLTVKIDVLQIEQVLVNLIRNAFDSMSHLAQSRHKLTITSSIDGNGDARVVIRDHGVGIDKENETKIFDAYFTTKRDGLGMGLAICRSIIEDHNGMLWYSPSEDKGAKFCFTLPLKL